MKSKMQEKKTPAEPEGQAEAKSDIGSAFGALISGQIPLSEAQHQQQPTSSSGYAPHQHHPQQGHTSVHPAMDVKSRMNSRHSLPTNSMQLGAGGSQGEMYLGSLGGGDLKGSYRTTVRHMSPKTPVHNSLAAFEPSFGQAQSSNPSMTTAGGGVSVLQSPNTNASTDPSYSYLDYPRVKRARQLVLGGHGHHVNSSSMEEGRNAFLSMSVGAQQQQLNSLNHSNATAAAAATTTTDNNNNNNNNNNNTNNSSSRNEGTLPLHSGGNLSHPGPGQPGQVQVQGPKRGNYRCSKCGQLKKGHICPFVKTKGKGKQMHMHMQSMAALAESQPLDNHQRMLTATMGPGEHGLGMNLAAYNSRLGLGAQSMQQQASASNHNAGSFAVNHSTTPTSQRVKGRAGSRLSPGTPSHMTPSHNTHVFLTPQKQKQANLTFTIAQGNRIEYRSPRQLHQAGGVPVHDNSSSSFVHNNHSNAMASASASVGGVGMPPQAPAQGQAAAAGGGYTSDLTMDEWLSRVFAQLDPVSLLSAAQVCRHWQKVASYVWNYVTDIKLDIDSGKSKLPKVVLKHAKKLESLRLHVGTSIDNTVIQELASVGSRSLKTLEITLDPKAKNSVTTACLQKLSKKCPSLDCLTIGGCSVLEYTSRGH